MEVRSNHYRLIEKAINFLAANKETHPSLEQVAEHVNLSPFHFQRLFTDWAGLSPKQFLQALTLQRAKQMLVETPFTLFDVTHELGLSSTSRLHDLFVKLEAMSPADFKRGAKGIVIDYAIYESCYGDVAIATTEKGVCFISFLDATESVEADLRRQFPNALISLANNSMQAKALDFINGSVDKERVLPLHVKGTAFQIKVWEALLKIPEGKLTSYGELAKNINMPKAARAVGTAIGGNPIAYLIPCHRVIQQSGALGGYRWGMTRKAALIAKESVLPSNNS